MERKYKDRLFRLLFAGEKELLSLYNAVNGTSYTNPEELEIKYSGECRLHEYEE